MKTQKLPVVKIVTAFFLIWIAILIYVDRNILADFANKSMSKVLGISIENITPTPTLMPFPSSEPTEIPTPVPIVSSSDQQKDSDPIISCHLPYDGRYVTTKKSLCDKIWQMYNAGAFNTRPSVQTIDCVAPSGNHFQVTQQACDQAWQEYNNDPRAHGTFTIPNVPQFTKPNVGSNKTYPPPIGQPPTLSNPQLNVTPLTQPLPPRPTQNCYVVKNAYGNEGVVCE